MNWNHKTWKFGILLAALMLGGPTVCSGTELAQAFLFPSDGTSADRNAGAKGMDLDFRRADNAAFQAMELPLNIDTATVTLSIGGSPINCVRHNLTPLPGQCGFEIVDGAAPGVEFSTLRVVFAGLFPASATVSIAVSNVKTAEAGAPFFSQAASDWEFTASATAPRPSVSLEMVFDISGSMGLPAAPPTNCSATTRMEALKDASQSIFSILESYSLPGDKLGIVYFTTTASAFGVAGGTNLKNANSAADRTAISGDLDLKGPTASTSVGGGLQLALTSGFATDTNPKKRVFLFSDGEQNTLPCAGEPNTAPCTSSMASSSPPLRVAGANYPSEIAVCPVTVGQFTGMAAALQQRIALASQCPHPSVHAIINHPTLCNQAADNLTTFFTQSLTNLLVGDKLELVRDVNGTIPAAGSSEKFFANANDVSLSILLSWSQRERQFIPFQLKAPDGTIVDPMPFTRIKRRMSFTTIPLPRTFRGATARWKGEWEIQFLSTPVNSAVGPTAVDYHLIVMLDNENIASDYQVTIGDPGTGEPIPVRVKLTEGGAPITGATAVAQMLGPENGLGNVLSTAKAPAGNPNTGGDVIVSDAQKKLMLLLQDPNSAGLFKDKNLPSLVLLDNGQVANGDTTANDGVYSGLFTGALLEGHYRFVVNVRAPSAANGEFQRTQLVNVHVRNKPAASNTTMDVVSSERQPDGSVIVKIKAIPKDLFGSFLGPGYGSGGLNFKTTEGTLQSITDIVDGSYVATIRLPSETSNPDITLEVMGTDVVTKPLDKIGGNTFKRWAFSLHAGSTFPHGVLGNIFNSGPSFGADLEYRFTPLFSLEAFLGHDRFQNSFFNDTFHITHLSLQPKFTFGTGTVRPSVHAGLGAYFPEGGGTRFGGNLGASVQFWITPNFAIEPGYNFRMINTSGSTLKYSTLHGGVRFRF